MAYVTAEYYSTTFHGHEIPGAEFSRVEADAADIIDGIVQVPISEEDAALDKLKRAVCYQIETLAVSGGAEALIDKAVNGMKTSERIDDYSVSRQKVAAYPTVDGVPVSPLTINLLRQLGKLKRWVYSEGLPDV